MAARISSVETIPIGLPFQDPYVTSTGTLERREMLIVRITDGDGATGWGDAVPLSLRGGVSLERVRAEIGEICAPVLGPAAITVEDDVLAGLAPLLDACAAAGAGRQALAGIEMALLDLIGKVREEPLWRLLGADAPQPVSCNGTLGADDPADAAGAAEAMATAGFETLKVKVGAGEDLRRIEAVREAAGPSVALRIDANGAWEVGEARDRLAELEVVGLELAEQPCRSIPAMAELRVSAEVPLVADESADTPEAAAECIGAGACDAVTIKLAKVGGVRAALQTADEAPAYLSSALDSPLGIAAAAHATQVLPARGFATGLAHGLATSGLFADNVADDSAFRGPSIMLGEAPGLGIEPDEAALERLRIR